MAKKRPAKPKLPEEFLKKLRAVTAKRPKTVIDHILKHGQITTEELRDVYGYGHPPRAARDVRDLGIPLETFSLKGADGRTIRGYRFGDPSKIHGQGHSGRRAFPKDFKPRLAERDGGRCSVCRTEFELSYLQIDHRVPYEVGGESSDGMNLVDFMLVCSSCNRAKSWACEHCRNWQQDHVPSVCQTCYWASPDSYAHIALELIRRLDITWLGTEVPDYDRLIELAKYAEKAMPDFVKAVLRDRIKLS
jgi:hypothetical protein